LNKKVQSYFKNSQEVAKSLTLMQRDVKEIKENEAKLDAKLD
jgi:flagellar biosynthesis chaperone FliJ